MAIEKQKYEANYTYRTQDLNLPDLSMDSESSWNRVNRQLARFILDAVAMCKHSSHHHRRFQTIRNPHMQKLAMRIVR